MSYFQSLTKEILFQYRANTSMHDIDDRLKEGDEENEAILSMLSGIKLW